MKIFRKIESEFVDERGAITKILDDGVTSIKSVLLITCTNNAIRANHFHKKDAHYCYLLSGKMEYFERPFGNPSTEPERTILEPGDMVFTPPKSVHAMRFLEPSVFLAFATESRKQKDYEEDTVRVKLL